MKREHKYKFASVILAAGKGSRMKSDIPKVMHRLAGMPMIGHVLNTVIGLGTETSVVVIAPHMDSVETAAKAITKEVAIAIQKEQHGTGHAVRCAESALKGFMGTVLVLYGDTPLILPTTLAKMLEEAKSAEVVVLGMRLSDPMGYGRLVTDAKGRLEAIVECKDATPKQKTITLCNSGVMAVSGKHLWEMLASLKPNNAAKEYYLTDLVEIANGQQLHCKVVEAPFEELAGVNSRAQLAEAEAIVQNRLRQKAMEEGATLVDPRTVTLHLDTKLGRDVVVHPHVVFGADVTVGDGVEIRSFSHLEGTLVEAGAVIGPFARLRPGSIVGEGAHVGNFVELKQTRLGKGAKANHLSYIGDAEIGEGANIGAGTITCNYDGFHKHKTVIGKGAFIGSNTSLVAPVIIGEDAIIGAGSVITEDVSSDDLAVARAQQINKRSKAKELRQRKKRHAT